MCHQAEKTLKPTKFLSQLGHFVDSFVKFGHSLNYLWNFKILTKIRTKFPYLLSLLPKKEYLYIFAVVELKHGAAVWGRVLLLSIGIEFYARGHILVKCRLDSRVSHGKNTKFVKFFFSGLKEHFHSLWNPLKPEIGKEPTVSNRLFQFS